MAQPFRPLGLNSGIFKITLRVPPPYVPQLSGNIPVFTGADNHVHSEATKTPTQKPAEYPRETISDPAFDPKQTAKPQQNRFKQWAKTLSKKIALNVRERILLGLLLLSLMMVPATIPQASVDARQYNPSDPNLESVERPEENFAGSAFYFIDPGYAIPQNYGEFGIDPLADAGDGSLDEMLNPAGSDTRNQAASAHNIRPVSMRGTMIDNGRALQCLTSAIYYEAGMEPDAGQRAVAQVILNRVRHPSYPRTVCGVIFQGSERRTGCQFSYTCDGSMRRTPNKYHWNRSRKVAAAALAGKIASPVGTATHYHTTEIYPYWAPSLRFLGTIGAHRFYSWKGSAGKASAFSQRYRGGEPLPAPKPRKYNARSASSLDPITLEKAYESGRRKAQEEAAMQEKSAAVAADNARRHALPGPTFGIGKANSYKAPVYSREALKKGGEKAFAGQKLPNVSQIKPKYRNSGSWKTKPGG